MFIPPMLCTTLRDPSRLGDPRYVAELKFDGPAGSGSLSQPPEGRGLQLASTGELGVGLSSRTLHASGGARPIHSHAMTI